MSSAKEKNCIEVITLYAHPEKLYQVCQDCKNNIYHYEYINIDVISHIYDAVEGKEVHLFGFDCGIERFKIIFPTIIVTETGYKNDVNGIESMMSHYYYSLESVKEVVAKCVGRKDIIQVNPKLPYSRFELMDLEVE